MLFGLKRNEALINVWLDGSRKMDEPWKHFAK